MTLAGLTILLVEDEPLIAMDTTMTLEEAGAWVHGPYMSVANGLDAMVRLDDGLHLDGAVIDYRLGAETCEPIADRLLRSSIPVIIYTGNSQTVTHLAERRGVQVVSKPASQTALVRALRRGVDGEL